MAATNKYSRVKNYPTPLVADMIFREKIDSNLPEFKTWKKGQPHHDRVQFPHHVLAHVEPAYRDDEGGQYWHYICDRDKQDLYNWEYSSCNIGGRKFDSVARTYVIPRDEYQHNTPLMGSEMPVFTNDVKSDPSLATPDTNDLGIDVDEFGSGWAMVEKVERRSGDPTIDSLYVIERREYVQRVTMESIDFDDMFGGMLYTASTIYFKDEAVAGATNDDDDPISMGDLMLDKDNEFWGLQADGTVNTAEQLSTEWYAITNRSVVPYFMVTTGRTYETNIDYSFPPVLSHFQIDIWNRRQGGSDNIATPRWLRDAYSGPCRAQISEKFFTTSTIPEVIVEYMLPKQVNIQTPITSLSTPPCLHGNFKLIVSTGTSHPEYYYTAGTFTEDKTTPEDWLPKNGNVGDYFVDSMKVQPMRGGFLRTIVRVAAPTEDDNSNPSYTIYSGSIDIEEGNPSMTVTVTEDPLYPLLCAGTSIPGGTLKLFGQVDSRSAYFSTVDGNGQYWSCIWNSGETRWELSHLTVISAAPAGMYWVRYVSDGDYPNPTTAGITWTPLDATDYTQDPIVNHAAPTGTPIVT